MMICACYCTWSFVCEWMHVTICMSWSSSTGGDGHKTSYREWVNKTNSVVHAAMKSRCHVKHRTRSDTTFGYFSGRESMQRFPAKHKIAILFVHALLQLEFHENVLNCVTCFNFNGSCTPIQIFYENLNSLHYSLYYEAMSENEAVYFLTTNLLYIF